MHTPRDALGQDIHIGDFVAHPISRGSSAAFLRISKVLSYEFTGPMAYVKRANHYNFKIKVHGVETFYNTCPPELLSRSAWLRFPERIMVIPENRIPIEIYDLFLGL